MYPWVVYMLLKISNFVRRPLKVLKTVCEYTTFLFPGIEGESVKSCNMGSVREAGAGA